MKHIRTGVTGALVALGVAAFSLPATAALKVQLFDGATTLTVEDGGVGDTNAQVGAITFNTTIGGWTATSTILISKPLIGGVNEARIDLLNVSVSGTGINGLLISGTDTDFSLPAAPSTSLSAQIGGTTDGTVDAFAYFDAANAEFGTTGLIGTLGQFGTLGTSSAFSDSVVSATAGLVAPFSLTSQVLIIHDGENQISSFDFVSTAAVPVPASILLFGSAIASVFGFGAIRRRRAQSASA